MFDLNIKPTNNGSTGMFEAVINYDTSDLSMIIKESAATISNSVEAYRSVMTQTLTESAGVINDDAGLIMEQANENIGQRLLKTLTAIKDWIVKKLGELLNAIQTFATSNKKVVDTIAKDVRERLSKGDYKDGPTADLYTYNMGIIDINRFATNITQILKTSKFNLNKKYTTSTAAELDEQVKAAKAEGRAAIAELIIKQVYKGPQASKATLENVKTLASEDIRGGEKATRKTVKFDKSYIDLLEANSKGEGDTAKNVKETFNNMSKELDKLIAEVGADIKSVKADESIEDKKFRSGKIAYYQEMIRLINIAIDILAMINSIKLQATIERVNEAKRFCVKAYHYKKPKADGTVTESADENDYPYAFSLTETGLDIDASPAANPDTGSDAW